jgi:hypothetical protein
MRIHVLVNISTIKEMFNCVMLVKDKLFKHPQPEFTKSLDIVFTVRVFDKISSFVVLESIYIQFTHSVKFVYNRVQLIKAQQH